VNVVFVMNHRKFLTSLHLNRARLRVAGLFAVVLLATLACSLPFMSEETPVVPSATVEEPAEVSKAATSTATPPPPPPTPTPQPLPPGLVESDPPIGSEIPLDASITLYFNQPMDRASVDAAAGGLKGRFSWTDEATVIFTPDEPLSPSREVVVTLNTSARAANGLALLEPIRLTYRSVGVLRMAQQLPMSGAVDVNPGSAVVATFNRPVVPLGVEADTLSPAFTLEPAAEGRGEWINTSTYAFYPEPALAGAISYIVSLDPSLTGVNGSPLTGADSWFFTTASPSLLLVQPEDQGQGVRLDASIELTFNQPMDTNSVESTFELLDPGDNSVSGEFNWDEDGTVMSFTPSNLLRRDSIYTINLGEETQASGGTPLGYQVSSSFKTIPPLHVVASEPLQGGIINNYEGITINLSGPIQTQNVLQFINLVPEPDNLRIFIDEEHILRLYGNFMPETDYVLTLSPNLPDAWSGRLGQEFILKFRTSPLDPQLTVAVGTDVLYLTPDDPSLQVQVTNLSQLSASIGNVPLEDFMSMLSPGGYELRQTYQPEQETTVWKDLNLAPNQSHVVEIPLTAEGESLQPGLYILRFDVQAENIYTGPYLLVVSNINPTLKISAKEALLWAIDLRDGTPVADVTASIYDEQAILLAEGETDAEGIMQSVLPESEDFFSTKYALLSQPGEDDFGLVLTTWSQGLEGWDFGLSVDYSPPHLEAYIYTDRPIYRPGQMVYFRAILREAYNGRYSLPDQTEVTFSLFDEYGELGVVESFTLPLSEYGSANGALSLSEDMIPGQYRLSVEGTESSGVNFQVTEYRKPEINLGVTFESDQYLAGEALDATVEAQYYFGVPVGNVPVKLAVYKEPADFYLPGYQVGMEDTRWLSPFPGMNAATFGELVVEGETETDVSGRAEVEVNSDGDQARQRYTIEVTVEDESGLPVSNRASVEVNPATFYIGVRPDTWMGQAGQEIGFDVLVVDWQQNPDGVHQLRADFNKVVWERIAPSSTVPGDYPTYEIQKTYVGSADFTTAEDGMARVAFTPERPGTYQLEVTSLDDDGGVAVTQVTIWAGGAGQAVWPNLPNQHLRLVADQDAYQPGQSAKLFVPNPFGEGTTALVTIERGTILRYQTLTVDGSGSNLTLPLGDEDAPNVYVSVTLLGRQPDGTPDFRQGYINLAVEPVNQTLAVTLTSEPQRAGPGDEITFGVQVSDAEGNPVEGEFSLAVVDLAVLALADPNSEEIQTAYYGDQPLGVHTGLALAGYAHRLTFFPGGRGGGGGEMGEPLVVREYFPDTAYWRAEITTNENGQAQVSMQLPDNLTTWQADMRGVTIETQVGQAEETVVVTKDLLVRPVTPRFLVSGDHAMLAAVVHNNTDAELQVEVSLEANGYNLDDPNTALQQIAIPAGGRMRVEWWGTVQDVESADLVFSARAGELQDATKPTLGLLPVLKYVAPQSFGTSGIMDEAGESLELVSLPRSYESGGGQLKVELSASLAAAMMNALDALEHYPYECTEQSVSRFLPNLETYRVTQEFGLDSSTLKTRLDRTLEDGLDKLTESQNEDGGWGWWQGDESDPYLTTYVLFGLVRAQDAGIQVDEEMLQNALTYVRATLPSVEMLTENWQFDRLAFSYFVLVNAGQVLESNSSGTQALVGPAALYEYRERLNPWAQALLALAIESLSPEDDRAQTLFSDLATSALRSATGAHWENHAPGWRNMSTTIHTTAVVLYALAQQDPASPLVADTVRYLMAHREASGGWAATYETAWTLMALSEVIKSTGELGGDFNFTALLNNTPLASGNAGGDMQLTPVTAAVPVSELYPQAPNGLLIERTVGQGRLYYAAHLLVNRPVEQVAPLENGFSVSRVYSKSGEVCPEEGCEAIQEAQASELVDVRLTLVVPESVFYAIVEDYIPAGAEILDINLKTSQVGRL